MWGLAAIQLCYATYTAIRHCASTVLPFLAGREENKKQPSEQSSRGAAWAWSQGGEGVVWVSTDNVFAGLEAVIPEK